MAALKSELDSKCFSSHYYFDEPAKILGEGAHASVYKCYKKSDTEKIEPFAVKIAREPDEEKRMAHLKEF